MSNNKELAPEVSLVWEVMTCLGLRTTYDRPDSPCHWFNDHYGPYPAYASREVDPLAGTRTDKKGSLPAVSMGKRYNVPEIMAGCRKAPIMSIGINPNLTAYQHGINGTTWCYPYFDDIAGYAKHLRYRTVNQERFPLDFIRTHLIPETHTVAKADGKIAGMSVKNDVLALNLEYPDGEAETIRLPDDHVLLFDTRDPYGSGASTNVFEKGDVIAGQLALPENVETEVLREPVGYYLRFQKMIETFRAMGDEALGNSQVRLGEDASMGDMVSCASPGWNAYFPDATRMGIVEECVKKRQHFRKQVIQSRPAVIVFSGGAALEMFMEAFPIEIMPKIDENQTTYERLKACLDNPSWLHYVNGEASFRSRIVFSPHFSYADNFKAGCRLRADEWDTFEGTYPEDAERVQGRRETTFSGVLVSINPSEEPYSTDLSAEGKSYLSNRYIDPIDAIAKVMLQEYDEKRLQLDNAGEHLVRTDGPCKFCKNELFQLGEGCLYNK